MLVGEGSDLEGPVCDAVGERVLGVSAGSFCLVEKVLEVSDFLVELDGLLGVNFRGEVRKLDSVGFELGLEVFDGV